MKFLAAYLLAKLGGSENPSADDLKKILGSVGAEVDDGKMELLLSLVKDHDLAELIANGKEKMAVLYSSAGVAAVAAGTGGAASAEMAGAAAEEKEKKKEEKEEIDEESDDGALFSLFD